MRRCASTASWRLTGSQPALNSNDSAVEVNPDTRRVLISLTDLQSTKQFYGHSYVYHLHPDGLEVEVDEVPVASFEFYPRSLSLDFIAPRPEADPEVVITGHIVGHGRGNGRVSVQPGQPDQHAGQC